MPVAECQERIDSQEFAKWKARYSLNPWGEWRADARAARVCQATWATHGISRDLMEFMPVFSEEAETSDSTARDTIQGFNMFAAINNAGSN